MEIPTIQATVVLLYDLTGRIILARKKQAIHHEGGEISYSLGLYNGYGGKREASDGDIFDTAIRELLDESGVRARKKDLDLRLRAYFYVLKEGNIVPFMSVSFFLGSSWEGIPVEGDEMGEPVFFEKDMLPYEEMMPADKFIFEKIISNEKGVYKIILRGKSLPAEISLLGEEL